MLNIAIIGPGIIGLSHIAAIKTLDNCRLTALCDVNESVVKPLAEENGVPYFLDYKDIPKNVECDAVILNLPHGLHCESSIFFLNNGIHVLVEKPMANTVEECDRMLEAAKKNNKKLAIAHIQRYFDTNITVKKIVESGELGKLTMISEQRSINYFLDSRPRWFLSKKAAGGGILMNYGAHALDKVQYITGSKVKEISGSAFNLKNDYDIEGNAQYFAKLENGITCVGTFSGYCAVTYENYYYFTEGALKLHGNHAIELIKNGEKNWTTLQVNAKGNEIAREITEFVKYILGEDANIADGEYGKSVIEAIEKVYKN